jgi:hypothetical protein
MKRPGDARVFRTGTWASAYSHSPDVQFGQPTGIAINRVASFDLTRANAMRLPLL